jgi:dihydroneopterin aldolase
MDVITLRGVRAYGKHGADPGERDRAQPLILDIRIEADLRAAAQADDLAMTIDYARLHARAVSIVESTSFALLERLAEAIVADIFSDARVARASVTIGKPLLLDGATPSVTIERENPSFGCR